MTEIATVSTETDETPEGSTSDTPETENGSEAPEAQAPKGNREARYRVERNEAREALSAAQSRIEALQLREVERLASELAQPRDLLTLGGVSLTDLLTEAGDVDSAAVAEAVAALIESRPGLARNPVQRYVDPSQGSGNNRPAKREPSFATLLKS
jgi:hypothetical protein